MKRISWGEGGGESKKIGWQMKNTFSGDPKENQNHMKKPLVER